MAVDILRIYLVDDEEKALQTLAATIATFFPDVTVVGYTTSIDRAFIDITELKPDIVLLDIEMGAETGFTLLEKFDRVTFQVAFVTAHEEYALRAIKLSAIDYIIKPAAISELKALFNKVRESKLHESNVNTENLRVKQLFGNASNTHRHEHKITIAVADGYDFVKVNNILYLKADGSYTELCLKDGSKIITSKGLKHYESILTSYGFFRIHNSTLINTEYVKRVIKTAGGSVMMEDDQEFSISKGRKDDFLAMFSLR